jgi:ABC-type taurine transport system substrate-binding protein
MAQTVEISLRVPSLRIRREGKEAMETVGNSDIRFIKHVALETIPKAGEVLTMTVSSGGTFECEVVRSDWHNEKNLFVIACRYSKRSISAAEYQALMDSSDWHVRALL